MISAFFAAAAAALVTLLETTVLLRASSIFSVIFVGERALRDVDLVVLCVVRRGRGAVPREKTGSSGDNSPSWALAPLVTRFEADEAVCFANLPGDGGGCPVWRLLSLDG